MSHGDPALMTRSMVTGVVGGGDGELSKIDDFILPVFPFMLAPLSASLPVADKAETGVVAPAPGRELVSAPPPR